MKRLILLLFSSLTVITSVAQPTLDECHRLAREHYPEIRQYDLISKTESYTLSNVARNWIPQIGFTAQGTWQTDVPTLPNVLTEMLSKQGVDMPGMEQDQYKLALELNQTIWDGGKSRADRAIARSEAEEQRATTDVNLYALEERVNNIYFGILLFDERIEQMNLTKEMLRSNMEKVRSLQQNGIAIQSDVDAMEAEVLTIGQQIVKMEASRNSFRTMLEILIGQPLGEEKLQRPSVSEPITLESARPELSLFDAKINRLKAQEQLVKSSTRPRFNLFAQGYYGYPGLDMFEGMLNNDWSWNAMIGVKMSWNFGAFYTKKNNLQKLRTAQQQVNVQRDVFLFNTSLQTAENNGEIESLKKALADDDKIVSLRRSVREAAEAKLENGIIDTNDLLRKITEEAQASTARSAREIELLMAIYELKHTINQ